MYLVVKILLFNCCTVKFNIEPQPVEAPPQKKKKKEEMLSLREEIELMSKDDNSGPPDVSLSDL